MCLAQGHNTVTSVGFKPRTSGFGVGRSTTMPPRSVLMLTGGDAVMFVFTHQGFSFTTAS